jgi:hypothetical protein
MKIGILCPTYGRPASMQRLVDSITSTCKFRNALELIFYIDNDDQESLNKARSILTLNGSWTKAITGPKIKLSQMWNVCAEHTDAEILMLCADDIAFRTADWDEIVRNEFIASADKILFVHGDDGYNGERFGTHGFLHRNWVETVGYFLPPYFSANWVDTWLNEVSNKIRRRRYIQILTEHLHFDVGKAEIDKTHQDRLARDATDQNHKIYQSLAMAREIDAMKLKIRILENLVLSKTS